ncbi:MAG TPA: DUF5606 domain-containing protein [Candidatus Cryptobacteroides intestinipullorum]|nr:DUF5606 domain-containing protein [Candidatus Cryptobacteroides intestinipullorum]
MKTDLTKVLTISGQSGLFNYISQARNGVIVESLSDKKRSCFGMNSKVTTLEDISIYTEDGEMKLKDVFRKMHGLLGEESAPAAKSQDSDLKEFFSKVMPDYDRERFHTSHMKKVVTWYNILKEYASLDFEEKGEAVETAGDQEA